MRAAPPAAPLQGRSVVCQWSFFSEGLCPSDSPTRSRAHSHSLRLQASVAYPKYRGFRQSKMRHNHSGIRHIRAETFISTGKRGAAVFASLKKLAEVEGGPGDDYWRQLDPPSEVTNVRPSTAMMVAR